MKRSVIKDMRRFPGWVQEEIRTVIQALAQDPRPYGSKKLKADDSYSARAGDYRVIYQINDQEQLVTILRARHRREAYEDL